jgi:hypothetical protein
MYKIGKVNLSLAIPLHGVDPWYNPGTFADGIKRPHLRVVSQVYVVPSCDIGSVLRVIGQVDLVALGSLTAMSNYYDLYAQ